LVCLTIYAVEIVMSPTLKSREWGFLNLLLWIVLATILRGWVARRSERG
jgi:hypothetical protein